MWKWFDSNELQSDVKQSVNVDGLFVRTSTFKSIINYHPSKIPTNSGIYCVFLNQPGVYLSDQRRRTCILHCKYMCLFSLGKSNTFANQLNPCSLKIEF